MVCLVPKGWKEPICALHERDGIACPACRLPALLCPALPCPAVVRADMFTHAPPLLTSSGTTSDPRLLGNYSHQELVDTIITLQDHELRLAELLAWVTPQLSHQAFESWCAHSEPGEGPGEREWLELRRPVHPPDPEPSSAHPAHSPSQDLAADYLNPETEPRQLHGDGSGSDVGRAAATAKHAAATGSMNAYVEEEPEAAYVRVHATPTCTPTCTPACTPACTPPT